MSRKGGGGGALQKDAPWRSSSVNPVPKIHHSPILRLPQTPYSNHAISVVKHPNPIGYGMATEAIVEAAGPYCIVPGQTVPIKLLGLKVWPVEVDLHFLKPVGRELKLLGKVFMFNFSWVFMFYYMISYLFSELISRMTRSRKKVITFTALLRQSHSCFHEVHG